MTWVVWAILLILQNASFTLVSRARNSSSLGYHAWASVLSNGVWFLSQLILFDSMLHVLKTGSLVEGMKVAVFYTACTMAGSLGMHWLALRKIEKDRAFYAIPPERKPK